MKYEMRCACVIHIPCESFEIFVSEAQDNKSDVYVSINHGVLSMKFYYKMLW